MQVIKNTTLGLYQINLENDAFIDKDKLLIGHSDCNYYMPYHSIFYHNILKKGDIEIIEYFLPLIKQIFTITRAYNKLVELFVSNPYDNYSRFHFKDVNKIQYNVDILSGMLMFQDKIIACLAVDTDYLLSIKPFDIKKNSIELDNSKLALFVHSSLYTEPLLKNLVKKFETLYVNKVLLEGVQIIKTITPLEKVLYGNNFKMPKFKTVEESNKFLKECITNKYLYE